MIDSFLKRTKKSRRNETEEAFAATGHKGSVRTVLVVIRHDPTPTVSNRSLHTVDILRRASKGACVQTDSGVPLTARAISGVLLEVGGVSDKVRPSGLAATSSEASVTLEQLRRAFHRADMS